MGKGKKGDDEGPPKRVILGRARNNVSIGIVGLPNVGKSSFFNTLSKLSVPAENFPFCTIEPNTAKVPVPDKRYRFLCEKYAPKSKVPAVLTVTDIAGLVKGAAEGAGLGNAFLSHIQSVDAIFHLCRAFQDKNVSHVEESVDPVRDLEIIHKELRLKDLEAANKYIEGNQKNINRGIGGKEAKFKFSVAEKARDFLAEGKDIRANKWDAKEIEVLNEFLFITAKPMVYLVNLSKKGYVERKSNWLLKIDEYVKNRGCNDIMIPFSVKFEEELLDAELAGPEERKKFLAGTKGRPMLPKIIHKGYEILDLIHYFTCGKDEVKCWTIRQGTLAPKAAGVIHTDFEKGFICAEVIKYDDFKALGSRQEVVKQGKVGQRGRNYEVEDGDIMLFKHNN